MDPEVIRRMRSSARYQRWRAAILRDEPLCRPCAEAGFTVAADHSDHIEPGASGAGALLGPHEHPAVVPGSATSANTAARTSHSSRSVSARPGAGD